MSAGIKEVFIITTEEDFPKFEQLLGTGQDEPKGLAEEFIIGEHLIG